MSPSGIAITLLSILLIIFVFIRWVNKSTISDYEKNIKDYKSQISELNLSKEEIKQNYDQIIIDTNSMYENRLNIELHKEDKLSETISSQKKEIKSLNNEIDRLNNIISNFGDNLSAFPFLAGIVADLNTYGYEILAKQLDWGHDQKRLKKVQDIREIRRTAKEQIEQAKEAEYQLKYLFELYPALEDVVECHFEELPKVDLDELNERDRTKDYLSKEEWESLSTTERNQLALDRYINSHNKTKWQIGRDYENYIGYLYEKDGYNVDYFGSYMGLEDLGRDLIVSNLLQTTIIQCKYWSSTKLIHEKHITQLYGTMISYCIENNMPYERVSGMLVTNIELSETAKKMANYLGIQYKEHLDIGNYPRIKCNIGHDEFGFKTKIYHLPFDQQYDSTKIKDKGEFFAMTVEEAEKAGFRRAFKWFGQ